MKTRKVFLSAGHTNVVGKDRGAAALGYIEGDLAVELRDIVAQHLRDMCIVVYREANGDALRGTLNYFRNLVNPDAIVVDIHFNAGPALATGTEVFIPSFPSKLEQQLAYKMAHTISSTLEIKKRGNFQGLKGVKSESESHHGRLGWMQLTGQNILLEICFLTNQKDMDTYQNNKIKLAYKIACDIASACVEQNQDEPIHKTHTVSRGDTLSGIAVKYNTSVEKIQQDNGLKTTLIQLGEVLTIK